MSGRKLIVKRRSHRATLPKRATPGSAGYDLYSAEACLIGPGERRIVATDISVKVPEDTYGRIAPRSGLAVKNGINVLVRRLYTKLHAHMLREGASAWCIV